MAWTRLHLQVLTPLFSGDAPTGPASVRVPSVRGMLRFWLRAVAAGRLGLVRQEDLPALWRIEEGVLGSVRRAQAGDSDRPGAFPSRIGLRITEHPADSADQRPEWARNSRQGRFDGAHYLLGQGLWHHHNGVTRRFIKPGSQVRLDVRFSGDPTIDARFMQALWAWLIYGGLGARTHRGFGQLSCVGVEGPLPDGWTAAHLVRPRRSMSWERLCTHSYPPGGPWDSDCWLLPRGATGGIAEHPALADAWWSAVLVGINAASLGAALHEAGTDWRKFRAGPDAVFDDDDLPCPTTRSPEWRQVVHGAATRYPVAALGLPVHYFSRPAFRANVSSTDDLRRASPVWIRPVRTEEGWQYLTFVFRSRLLPAGAGLTLSRPAKRLDLPSHAECERAWTSWLDGGDRLPPGVDLRPDPAGP